MAEKNNPNDQLPRTQKLGESQAKVCNEIPLVESARRLRMAECSAKGGEYRGGKCCG